MERELAALIVEMKLLWDEYFGLVKSFIEKTERLEVEEESCNKLFYLVTPQGRSMGAPDSVCTWSKRDLTHSHVLSHLFYPMNF